MSKIERSVYGQRILAAVAKFPGATYSFGKTSKHNVVTLTFNGKSRDVIFPASPSDHRGAMNCASDCSKALIALGATRAKSEKGGQSDRPESEKKMEKVS